MFVCHTVCWSFTKNCLWSQRGKKVYGHFLELYNIRKIKQRAKKYMTGLRKPCPTQCWKRRETCHTKCEQRLEIFKKETRKCMPVQTDRVEYSGLVGSCSLLCSEHVDEIRGRFAACQWTQSATLVIAPCVQNHKANKVMSLVFWCHGEINDEIILICPWSNAHLNERRGEAFSKHTPLESPGVKTEENMSVSQWSMTEKLTHNNRN